MALCAFSPNRTGFTLDHQIKNLVLFSCLFMEVLLPFDMGLNRRVCYAIKG